MCYFVRSKLTTMNSNPLGVITGAGTTIGNALGLSGATSAVRFVGGTESGAPTSGSFKKGDFVITQDGITFICTVSGSPGTWVGAETQAHATATYETKTNASATYATQATTTTISSSLTDALSRITTLENSGGGSPVTTGTWTATMVVECNNGSGAPFTTVWSWMKIGSFVFIKCITHDETYSLLPGATTAHFNCSTPLPESIRPLSWTGAIDIMVMYGRVSGSDNWQYQNALIQFSPNATFSLNSGIRIWQMSGGNDFTGWNPAASDKSMVFPTGAYTYSV
jgi:hypothetical protein